MKLFGRCFLFPILIHKTNTIYFDHRSNLQIRFDKSGSAGSAKTTSYTLEVITKKNRWQWSLCWRPDVTRYWWKRSKKNA